MTGRQTGTTGAQYERVRSGQVDLLDWREHSTDQALIYLAGLTNGTDVTGCGDHGHVVGGGELKCGVESGHLGMAVAVLPAGLAGGAYRNDATNGAPQAYSGHRGCHRVGGIVEGLPIDEDLDEGGAGGDGVYHLGVQYLLSVRQPRRCGGGEGGHDPELGRG